MYEREDSKLHVITQVYTDLEAMHSYGGLEDYLWEKMRRMLWESLGDRQPKSGQTTAEREPWIRPVRQQSRFPRSLLEHMRILKPRYQDERIEWKLILGMVSEPKSDMFIERAKIRAALTWDLAAKAESMTSAEPKREHVVSQVPYRGLLGDISDLTYARKRDQ